MYSGPPPPYSCAPSTTESGNGLTGYFSPTHSSRRSIKDEKDLLPNSRTLPSLPSLHEALGGDKAVPFSGPPSASQSNGPGSTPVTAVGQTFPDAPRGPPNPFSHSTTAPTGTSGFQSDSVPPKITTVPSSQPFSSSPRVGPTTHRPSDGSFSSVNRRRESSTVTSPYSTEPTARATPFPEYAPHSSSQPATTNPFTFEPSIKFDDTRNPFARVQPPATYGDTVKRHLDHFDAEVALSEVSACALWEKSLLTWLQISEISGRTCEHSRYWMQRHHQGNRSSSLAENGPSVNDIDTMIQQQQRVLENLNRIREVVVQQQNLLSEQRARAARGHPEDQYQGLPDEYGRAGGFAGGDAKKRRGVSFGPAPPASIHTYKATQKAAPPGRCHSCNRAETPEWRRGPDGARTLCNACGLHYAKLTRKLGANKASALTGSSLRPKGLDSRSPHV